MPKADNTTVLLRVEEVLRIRIDGAQFHDIREYAVEKAWGVSDTQLRLDALMLLLAWRWSV